MSADLPVTPDVDILIPPDNGEDNTDQATAVSSQVRESADGGSTPPLIQAESVNESRTDIDDGLHSELDSSEKEKENGNEDLDKDIDAMVEVNTDNGFINPDASNTISSIQIDLTGDSVLDMDDLEENETTNDADVNTDKINMPQAVKSIPGNVVDAQLEVTEKSFASSTDSSVVAEAVVKKVIEKAVTEIKINTNSNADTQNSVAKSDIKVGLFQYGGVDDENGSDSNTEETEDEAEEAGNDLKGPSTDTTQSKGLKVGLFQYLEEAEDEEVQSPEVIEMEDNDDGGNRQDILKLYGLEGLDPVSPKSASPPESGPVSVDQVLDVQRDVYEPQTRLFSVTRSLSSTDSTPRNGYTEQVEIDEVNMDEAVKSLELPVKDDFDHADQPSRMIEGDVHNELNLRDIADDRTDPQAPEDVSPPLVQYEPVTDNGKFRIVKTLKEGGTNAFGGIIVGSSPSQSPRETGSLDSQSPREARSQEGQGLVGKGSSPKQATRNQEENKTMNDSAAPKAMIDSLPVQTEAKTGPSQIDKDLIRELIEREKISGMVPTRDSATSDKTPVELSSFESTAFTVRSHGQDAGRRSPEQMSLSDLHEPPIPDGACTSGTKPSPREETLGGEDIEAAQPQRVSYGGEGQGVQRHDLGRSEDSRSFERRYQKMLEHDSYFSRSYDRNRYISEEPSKDVDNPSSRYPATYQDAQFEQAAQRSVEPASRQPIKHVESGVIPGFKTLQQQQAKWSDMFRQLESEHKHELRSQYDKHQSNIKRLQQQMEHELQKQHIAIRKRLDIHKEALAKMSPEQERYLQDRRYRSPDRSMSPGGRGRDQDLTSERSGDVSELQNSSNSKSWREIYREVRAEESDQDPEPSPRLQRALDLEFASLDVTAEKSRSSASRPSPRGRSNERNVSGHDASRSFADSFPASFEEKMSRSSEREPRSKVKFDRSSSPMQSTENDRLNVSTGSDRACREQVSPHVQELLDNLKDSHRSLRGLEDDPIVRPASGSGSKSERSLELSAERPRAGVYSSPMPVFKGKGAKAAEKQREEAHISPRATKPSRRSMEASFQREMEMDGRRTLDYRELAEQDRSRDSINIEDTLSSSERVNLREKHSKHLSDLRAYYEEELRELRKALSDSIEMTVPSADTSMQSTIQNHLLEAENRHLLDKVKAMEEELEELYARVRTSEQKNIGLEKRASEYAAAFGDSQAMAVQHRAHIEELQRYCRERDDLVNDLESKVRSQEDGVKLYKKSFDEERELHRQDKIALQRITERYESMDREYKLLQETMTSTENKLYDARTEIVELNRAMSKIELENKRLGRENDNLRHKVTQSLNLSTMHDSFGSPSSPRGEVKTRVSQVRPRSPVQIQASNELRGKFSDDRTPGFTGTSTTWNSTETRKETRKPSADSRRTPESQRKSDANVGDEKTNKKEGRPVMSKKEVLEASNRKHFAAFKQSSSEEVHRETNFHERSRPPYTEEPVPVRDRTPPRSSSVASQVESEISDYSPLLKAERELFKLRDMMRQAVAIKPSDSPPQPKLQKKFYGSERPTSKEDYAPDLGPGRGRKEQPNQHGSVVKTKSVPAHSKSDRTSERVTKKVSGSGSDRGSTKSKEKSSDRKKERREKPANQALEDGSTNRTPPRRKPVSAVNPELYDSPTRFDINVNEDRRLENQTEARRSGKQREDNVQGNQNEGRRMLNGDQKREDKRSSTTKQRNLFESNNDEYPVRDEPTGAVSRNDRSVQENGDRVTSTLDMMRNGQYTTRPEWEDVFTSMVKPKPETQEKVKTMTTEEKVKERLRSISEMESRYDGLQAEKRQLESSINKIPLHGRVDRNNRREKEKLEERLESVDREIGSLKMTLKRYNVLKTAG